MQQDICYEELDNGVILVTTSYLDRHNDYIQIYCIKDGDDYLLTDDSWTLDNLEQSGLVLESAKNQDILKATLNKFGILRQGTELYIKTGETELNIAQENFARAIFAINSMKLGS